MKKCSVITVCRNEVSRIEGTCRSVVAQTCKNYEWIVIDGGSNDGTLQILERYKDHMAVLISEKDHGIYQAMNKGIREATGEYVIFLNGGDSFHHDEVLQEVFSCSEYTRGGGDVLYGDAWLVKNMENVFWCVPENLISPFYFIDRTIPHQSAFIRRELFRQYGYYDEKFRICSDVKFWIILTLNKRTFRHISNVVCNMDGHGLSSVRRDLALKEHVSLASEYFHMRELVDYRSFFPVCWYKILGIIPVIKIIEKRRKRKYLLFGVLPVLYKVID